MTLTEFLLARIAEDEAAARECSSQEWAAAPYMPEQTDPSFRDYYDRITDDAPAYELDGPTLRADDLSWPIWNKADAEHIARHDPARVLAECEAKRRIVEQVSKVEWGGYAVRDVVLGHLAAVYADHPDYRADWS